MGNDDRVLQNCRRGNIVIKERFLISLGSNVGKGFVGARSSHSLLPTCVLNTQHAARGTSCGHFLMGHLLDPRPTVVLTLIR